MDIYPSYTYYLRWTSHNKQYYGVRTANKVAPEDDLWTHYFTSSEFVSAMREEHGEPDIILIDEVFETPKEAVAYETLFLKEHNWRSDEWLNCACFPAMVFTEEYRRKLSEALKGKVKTKEHLRKIGDANKGKVVSSETRHKLRDANLGKKASEETKRKISEALKGRKKEPCTEEHKRKLSEALKGRKKEPCTEETKRKLSEANKGRVFSEETRRKMSEARKGKIPWNKGKSCKATD